MSEKPFTAGEKLIVLMLCELYDHLKIKKAGSTRSSLEK